MSVWFLHGFLGQGSDWDAFDSAVRDAGWFSSRKVDLFGTKQGIEQSTEQRAPSPAAWAKEFCARVKAEDPDPVLVGYSLGGRLALHALLEDPLLFGGAVIISASPGIDDVRVRAERAQSDEAWATRFESEDWDSLLEAWNKQAVFQGQAFPRPRHESDFRRSSLAHALRAWSPGRQDPLYSRLHEIRVPVLWIAGERDANYVEQSERVEALIPDIHLWRAPAGHRVPWEIPEVFERYLRRFLSELWPEGPVGHA